MYIIFTLWALFLQGTLRHPPKGGGEASMAVHAYNAAFWGKLKQEPLEFGASLSYTVSPLISTNKQNNKSPNSKG